MRTYPGLGMPLRRLLCLPAPTLLVGSGLTGTCADLNVVLSGPESAPPNSGPHLASVQSPLAGVAYQWVVTSRDGALLDASGAPVLSVTGTEIRFRTGSEGMVELTCKAKHDASGETGAGLHRVLVPLPRLSVHVPDRAGYRDGPLVAWVESPAVGKSYRWAIEGGDLLSPFEGDHVLFRTGDGKKVTLVCQTVGGNHSVSSTIPLDPTVQLRRRGGLGIELSATKSYQGAAGLKATVAAPDATAFVYRWQIQGGQLQEQSGTTVPFTAGNGTETLVRCLAMNRKSGAMEVVEAKLALEPGLPDPDVEVSDQIFMGQQRFARVRNIPVKEGVGFIWSGEGLAAESLAPGGANQAACRYRAVKIGPATLTCRLTNKETNEEKVWNRTFQVLPARALIPPVRIMTFTCDPPSPLKVDAKAARLHWTLDESSAPETLVLREMLTGREWKLDPKDRSFHLPGPLQGRYKFSLTTTRHDKAMDELATDTSHQDLAVPGVSVLAGDADKVGSGYMKAAAPGVTPWTGVTGMAWKSPWLYISQGSHHTIRRVRAIGADLEEVAGMRGLPRVAKEEQDRLYRPAQLLHRNFNLPDGKAVADWVVLEPEANCIQAFTEGDAKATMRVLVGDFLETAAIKKARQNQEGKAGGSFDSKHAPQALDPADGELTLLKPAAMAVHPATGQLFVADKGHRAIKQFSPMGERVRTLVRNIDADGLAVNAKGDVFYADPLHHVVRVLRNLDQGLDLDTRFSAPEVFAGTLDSPGAVSGRRTGEALLRGPMDLTVAQDATLRDCLFIADTGNHLIRKVLADPAAQEEVETFAGNEHILMLGKDTKGFQDGSQMEARFSFPRQLCGDGHGNLYVQDQTGPGQTPVIRVVTPFGEVTTQGGCHENTSRRGRADGKGSAAGFDRPAGLAVTAAGTIYVADSGNQCIRRIGPDGQVTVAAGREEKPTGGPYQDDGSRDSACFGAMSSMGIDAEGRILVLEPQFRRLRMVAFKETHPKEKDEVATIKADLKGTRVAIFPASAQPSFRYPFVLATPDKDDTGRFTIRIMRAPSATPVETVDTELPLQALCADRANRIWAVLTPDPAAPTVLRIMRYAYDLVLDGETKAMVRASPEWVGVGARLSLAPKDGKHRLDGRDYETCGVPDITAIATDSRNNLYLADAGNGTIWKVDEALREVTRVAGAYPYLGPIGRELQGPLAGMQGLALTPEDDLVVTCGNAVLQITRQHPQSALPWVRSELLLWKAPARKTVKEAPSARARLTKLLDPNQQRFWSQALKNSEGRRTQALEGVLALQRNLQRARQAHQTDPTSLRHKKDQEQLPRVLAEAEQDLAFATAEAAAKQAGFEYLLLLDQGKAAGLSAKEVAEFKAKAAIAEAVSQARRARFECLLEAREMAKKKPDDPSRAAAPVRMAYLEAYQQVRLAEAERLEAALEAQQQPQLAAQTRPPDPVAAKDDKAEEGSHFAEIRAAGARRARMQAQKALMAAQQQTGSGGDASRLGKAKALEGQKLAELKQAEQAARDFEKANPGMKIRLFVPWTTKGNPPPVD